MKMKRNCNLELRLLPPPYFPDSDLMEQPSSSGTPEKEEHQKMTIFYDGRICVSDVTHLQAKAIIMLAQREMEEGTSRSPNGSGPPTPNCLTRFHHHHRVQDPSLPLYSPNAGASMKRSLQRFLQKRKDRIQSTSPYH